MGSHIIDSIFFTDQYSTAAMRQTFNDDNLLQKWLDVEAALARAEAKSGMIPQSAANEISIKAKAYLLNKEAIAQEMKVTSHPIVPVIRALEAICDEEAGQYIHWGATSQDITDTAVILQMKDAAELITTDLTELENVLLELAGTHRDTIMPGRTHGQHALPITFGYKLAIWADEIHRHLARLQDSRPRIFMGQFAGAVGTLASVPEHGLQIQQHLFNDLGLFPSVLPWHTARDGIVEFITVLAMISATLGKMAREVINLQRTEIAELEEPFVMGKVGSSTMPHKRNPMICEAVLGITRIIRQQPPIALEAMSHEHERDWAMIHMEWVFVPETCLLTSGALAQMLHVFKDLVVYPDRMRENVNMLHGLILSEAIMLALGLKIGRQHAHDVVYRASMRAHEKRISLKKALMDEPAVSQQLTEREIDDLLVPDAYTGLSGIYVDRVLNRK